MKMDLNPDHSERRDHPPFKLTMISLIVVNSILCEKTEKFWSKNRLEILDRLKLHKLVYPESKNYKLHQDLNEFDVIVLIGDDIFFSCFVNSVFYNLSDKEKIKHIAFIPDRRNTAIASGLCLPDQLSKQLELIQKKQSVFMDLVRCHYIDKKGIPRSHFVLNDVLLGISPSRVPLVFQTIVELAKNPPLFPSRKKTKVISITTGGAVVYEGKYVFSAVLLGNKFTNGPKIPSKAKIRANLTKFEYYQLNSRNIDSFKKPFKSLFGSPDNEDTGYIFSGGFDELIIKGEGPENTIIADGIYLGRIPATFSLLPRAIRVIAPMLTIRIAQPSWKSKVAHSTVPKPVGRQPSLNKDCRLPFSM